MSTMLVHLIYLGLFLTVSAQNATELNQLTSSVEEQVPSVSGKDSEVNPLDAFMMSLTTASPSRTFKDEEKAMLDYVNKLIRQFMPYVMGSSSTKLSSRCMSTMMKAFTGIRKLKGWTLKLLDSSGKLSPGIMSGRSYSMGDYDQCLSLSVDKSGIETLNDKNEMFRGKYCLVRFKQSDIIIDTARKYHRGDVNGSELGKMKEMIDSLPYVRGYDDYMSHFVGVCIPSACTDEDVNSIISSLPLPGEISLEKCETRKSVVIDVEQQTCIGFLLFLVLLVTIGTVAEFCTTIFSSSDKDLLPKRKVLKVIIGFSIISNTKKLLQRIRDDHDEKPDWTVIRGLYVLTVMLLIVYHTCIFPFDIMHRNIGNLSNFELYMGRLHFSMFVTLPVAMETLFLIHGFIVTNTIWKASSENKDVTFSVLKTVFLNYLRFCLPLLFCWTVILLLPLVGSGPFWDDIFADLNNCRGQWGRVFGIYENFLGSNEQCLPHFWFVPCLIQLIIISSLLLIILTRWIKIGTFVIICGIIACNVAVGIETSQNDFPPSYLEYFRDKTTNFQWKIQQSLPIVHFTPFVIGMLLGIFVTKKNQFEIKRVCAAFGWIIAFSLFGVSTLTVYQYNTNNFTPSTETAAFAPLQKSLYGLAVAWVILACAYGKSGFSSLVKSILSWSVFDPLYKLSFLAYLIHLVVISFHAGIARELFHYSHMDLILRAVSYVVISYGLAYISHMILIMPFKSVFVISSPKSRDAEITNIYLDEAGSGIKSSAYIKPANFDDSGYFNKIRV